MNCLLSTDGSLCLIQGLSQTNWPPFAYSVVAGVLLAPNKHKSRTSNPFNSPVLNVYILLDKDILSAIITVCFISRDISSIELNNDLPIIYYKVHNVLIIYKPDHALCLLILKSYSITDNCECC